MLLNLLSETNFDPFMFLILLPILQPFCSLFCPAIWSRFCSRLALLRLILLFKLNSAVGAGRVRRRGNKGKARDMAKQFVATEAAIAMFFLCFCFFGTQTSQNNIVL